MKELRDKGLYYNCDEKWATGHKCRAIKLFIMECEDSGDEEEANATPEGGSSSQQFKDEAQAHIIRFEPGISIHAIIGSPSPRTMRILGQVQGVGVVILLDTGSTHNFLNLSVITKAQLPVYHTPGLSVKVPNGEALHNDGITKQAEF